MKLRRCRGFGRSEIGISVSGAIATCMMSVRIRDLPSHWGSDVVTRLIPSFKRQYSRENHGHIN